MAVDTHRKKRNRRSGFTLIEIMVVVMIIGMLATLVGVRVIDAYERAQRKAAVTQINNLETALQTYRLEFGRYPTTEQGLDALVKQPSIEPIPRNYPQNGILKSKEVPLDPWKNSYVYFCPGLNGEEYTIVSYGKDGAEGGEGNDADIDSGNLDQEAR
jgi:general secretion pathway protein G